MGRALQLLTDDVAADFKVVLDLLVTVVGAVQWERIRKGKRDVYLYLYEQFLENYDPAKRQASGTYYTPRELVVEMVRLVENVLTDKLLIPEGFRSHQVTTVDPAMGTGTYLHTIIDRVNGAVEAADGLGAVPGAITELAARLAGFEIQMGPYAVAELRITELLASLGAQVPKDGLRLFVTDTLDDPYAAETQLASGLATIAKARRQANKIKSEQPVTVVIGNPPYRELAAGGGGWVEHGSDSPKDKHVQGILQDFLLGVPGKLSAKLKNLYVYFYRWATWKVWESTPTDQAGVVCFITTSGYLTGPAFTAMRSYLRRESTEGWIIDLTPEGQTPDIPTRIFPGVRQPLAIGLFVRTTDNDTATPAALHYTALTGLQADKFSSLAGLQLSGANWQTVRTAWSAPFTPAPLGHWDTWPAVSDLLPWYSPGLFPTRTWVYSPSPDALQQRWGRLVAEPGAEAKNALMKAGRDAHATKTFPPLPGTDVVTGTETRLEWETRTDTKTIRVGYRAFDRQHVIPDRRLLDMPRLPLWHARQPGQVFVVEQHRRKLTSGPALVFSHLIPDFDYFKGSEGGRTMPWLHPNASPNLPDGLTRALATLLGVEVHHDDVLAYVAATTANPAFTKQFAADLETPGVRVPITADSRIWSEAVELGREVLWVQTYGEAFAVNGREVGNIRYSPDDPARIRALVPVQGLPSGHEYDAERAEMVLGTGRFGPVSPAAFGYGVGGRNVIKGWVDYRKEDPAGKKSTPLDYINPTHWEHAWTGELIDLLTVLDRLTKMEPAQAALLEEIVEGQLLTSGDLAGAGVVWGTNTRPVYDPTMP
nr:type ISP restriction/modification enzyme [Tessaracoccus sp. OS52]